MTTVFGDEAKDAEKMIAATDAENILCMECVNNGALPGVATMKIYVGAQFADGETIYLYQFQTQYNQPRLALLTKEGLTVNNGYVECLIDSGASYFFADQYMDNVDQKVVTAQEWLYGDANLDRTENLNDAYEVLIAALGIKTQSLVSRAASDVNQDKRVDLSDANNVLLMALQIKSIDEIQNRE